MLSLSVGRRITYREAMPEYIRAMRCLPRPLEVMEQQDCSQMLMAGLYLPENQNG